MTVLAVMFASCHEDSGKGKLSYYFDKPAAGWEECLPQGNGRIGLMADGNVEKEKIVLNEISMWSGSHDPRINADAVKYLGEIRSLLFQGRNDEAQDLTYRTFTCAGEGSNRGDSHSTPYGSYQLFGNLYLDYAMKGDVSLYRRELNLRNAVQTVSYRQGGVNYRREIFASYKDDVIVIRLTADRKGAIGFTLSMDRNSNVALSKLRTPVCSMEDGDLIFSGRLPSGTEDNEAAAGEGIRFESRTRVLPGKGGKLLSENGTITVSDADEVLIITGMKTDYFGGDIHKEIKEMVDNAASRSWKKLYTAHTDAFGELMDRVKVDFGHDAAKESLPIDRRLAAFRSDHSDPSLVSLYYQFGRYLLISSTRPGCLPPNLQGLWANTISTPWNGDYHLNINLQMNHWPAETGNLSELHLPLIEWTKAQVESGRNTARTFYNSRGWVTHILGNVWNFTYPGEHPSWGATNTSAAWLCQHLYRHYQYTMDKDYLRDVYPTMKEAALFFVDMLVEDPRSHYLVTAPTTSPELSYWFKGKDVSLCAGSTMDNQIVRELFTNVTEAAGILGVDKAFCDTLAQKKSRLMPTTVGEDGRIMEWLEPRQETDVHHRHTSHLYGLYPGDEISVTRTPELARAAVRTLEVRGDESTGWSMAWKINFWARLHDGNHAYKLFCDLLNPVSSTGFGYGAGGGTYPNLFCAHPPFQIDGNFGGCAGIAEMLVQSHEGFIELLPALPDALKDGSFSGLCVRGGAEVSAEWADGKLTYVRLKAKNDGEFNIKDVTDGSISLRKGEIWEKEFPRCDSAEAAKDVITAFAGKDFPVKLALSLGKKDGCDRFIYRMKDGVLHIDGSSNLALCRGFYEYVKSQEAGICSWSGNRFAPAAKPADTRAVSKTSPFRHHYYFNVVTYGYTMAYWDWERWSREIDWMALHGIDMPLALVANEAITARVWKKLGLKDEEIADYFVGPAHFPWMRMGNISHHDGPLPQEWHEGQIALMHKILDRMRALDMSPICPAFAGFVPRAMKRLYPDLNLMEMSWSGGAFHNWMLDPQDELFGKIGRMFIEEWEKEFGKCDYYLADSFNEMDIPFPPKGDSARYELLADYGEKVYGAIKAGNPDAVWVMQGWMFGYQHDIWDYETLAALVSKVPDDKMLLLDLAADYNKCKWHSEYNWEYYKGFFGKQWVYSVIPNMGGKTGLTGMLDFYANGRLEAMNSANRGNLAAFGFAPEGIENNEVIYELLSDAGWTEGEIDLDRWLDNYSACRYGAVTDGVRNCWKELRQGVYGSFEDHPRYVWQFRPGLASRGSIHIDSHLYDAVKAFASARDELGDSPLYAADLEELTAHYLGAKMEEAVLAIYEKVAAGDDFRAERDTFLKMGASLDRVLASHPNLKLDNWTSFARKWGRTPQLADYYESNAKRLITVWGPPVDDYSARIWSGLVRDYYLPRWQLWFSAKENGTSPDFAEWEENWVRNSSGVSPVDPYEDPVSVCIELINDNF